MASIGGLRVVRKRMTDPVDSLTQAVAERAIDLLVDAVDVNALLDRVDVNRLLDRVDMNTLLDRIDVSRLLDRVDANRVLDRVDAMALVARVDVNSVVTRIDIDSLVEETDIGAVISRSSTSAMSRVLDVVRGQSVRLDELIARGAGRLRRRYRESPGAPELLRPAAGP